MGCPLMAIAMKSLSDQVPKMQNMVNKGTELAVMKSIISDGIPVDPAVIDPFLMIGLLVIFVVGVVGAALNGVVVASIWRRPRVFGGMARPLGGVAFIGFAMLVMGAAAGITGFTSWLHIRLSTIKANGFSFEFFRSFSAAYVWVLVVFALNRSRAVKSSGKAAKRGQAPGTMVMVAVSLLAIGSSLLLRFMIPCLCLGRSVVMEPLEASSPSREIVIPVEVLANAIERSKHMLGTIINEPDQLNQPKPPPIESLLSNGTVFDPIHRCDKLSMVLDGCLYNFLPFALILGITVAMTRKIKAAKSAAEEAGVSFADDAVITSIRVCHALCLVFLVATSPDTIFNAIFIITAYADESALHAIKGACFYDAVVAISQVALVLNAGSVFGVAWRHYEGFSDYIRKKTCKGDDDDDDDDDDEKDKGFKGESLKACELAVVASVAKELEFKKVVA